MNKKYILMLFSFFLIATSIFSFSTKEIEQAKKQMIEESISSYFGPCPCPYNVMRNGKACGKRSAYSCPNGAAPLCYASDISDAKAEQYLKRK